MYFEMMQVRDEWKYALLLLIASLPHNSIPCNQHGERLCHMVVAAIRFVRNTSSNWSWSLAFHMLSNIQIHYLRLEGQHWHSKSTDKQKWPCCVSSGDNSAPMIFMMAVWATLFRWEAFGCSDIWLYHLNSGTQRCWCGGFSFNSPINNSPFKFTFLFLDHCNQLVN